MRHCTALHPTHLDPRVQDRGEAEGPQECEGGFRAAVSEDGEDGRDEKELEVDAQVPAVCGFVLCWLLLFCVIVVVVVVLVVVGMWGVG